MPEQRRVLFAGNVHGVGLRYTTHRIAGGHDVTGYVRNLDDGRVELVAEGARATIDALLAEVRDAFRGNIRSETCDTLPATGAHTGFDIRR